MFEEYDLTIEQRAALTNYVSKPVAERVFINAADARAFYGIKEPASDQREIRAQILAFDERATGKKQRVHEVRALAAKFVGVSLEDIATRARLYSGDALEDSLLQLRAARQGYSGADFSGGFAANSPRDAFGNGGAVADPTQSLRDDDDDDFDPSDADDKEDHERATEYHRARARSAANWQRGVDHFKAADLHSRAAQSGDPADSDDARWASLSLKDVS